IWKAQEELVNFKGQIIFEVRASLLGGYYTITDPKASARFKKKKLMSINWTGGNAGERVKIELVRAGVPDITISESVGNQGNYIWTIPKNTKPSKSYQVKISNTADLTSQGLSKAFRIKGKSGAGIVVFTLLAGGAGAAYVLSQEGGGGGNGPIDEALPLPPIPQQ
ncbi:MAG TPA: Ser-Thr-rich GPI-anchored membrane family protein, partial [Cyclobacteriaceae bacterium]|nr:Ser-Thr-rich GPI-anchored membrane family protein [Cyclobacteriaceae bacterium]